MAAIPKATIENIAASVYEQCLQAPSDYLFSIPELQQMVPGKNNAEVTTQVINELLSSRSFTALKQGNHTVFRVLAKDFADKVKNMSGDEEILYGYIAEAAREGIWTRTLKLKSKMHNTTMTKALKALEGKKCVKSIKSVKYPTRKIYMLYELTPSIDQTGGPWFTDSELDKDFINALLTAMTRYVTSRSFPRITGGSNGAAAAVASFPPNYTGYPTLNHIYLWVKNSNLATVELAEADIKSLLDVLVYDGQIERVVGGTAYRAVRIPESINGFTDSPCGRCPVFSLCKEGGPVSASNCKYFEDWLNAV
ncbi:34-kDa subunit of RNA polymerase III (C) [Rhizina undulata]